MNCHLHSQAQHVGCRGVGLLIGPDEVSILLKVRNMFFGDLMCAIPARVNHIMICYPHTQVQHVSPRRAGPLIDADEYSANTFRNSNLLDTT